MKKDRRPQDSASPIETLRLVRVASPQEKRTQLSQAEFAVLCGIPLRTYQRWISGETEAKPTPRQWKAMIQILNIQSIEEIPDDFEPVDLTDN
ncbi:DNA-binding transcriptional regulator [Lyngbya sp. PCC 8106]|uniref:helix-turn-helix domain-containing protein n=1 Tax=Lyngbya sp. (strain PCC 8106) TaxID=313612 RepID=UPI0000EA97AB|nr:helix-turn-helix transcriptional regulator [Lyngbya sp. PCC 8106]EAW36864.1 hypothetical protein L8106_26922 [Lyngbya sp. PCC 8106]